MYQTDGMTEEQIRRIEGEVRPAHEIGYVGRRRYMWCICPVCNKGRWVGLTHGIPTSRVCCHCTLSRRGGHCNGRAESNSNWKADSVNVKTGRCRAERWYLPKPCEVCGAESERHHKDGNTLNNETSNIAFLCRKHHMEADGRLVRRNHEGEFASVSN
jgi:hypothetical protein